MDHHGRFYAIDGMHPGPPPMHPIGAWIGAIGPRMLELTGRVADGWAEPLPRYLSRERWDDAQRQIDAGARTAGRDPKTVRRIAQLPGEITDQPAHASPLGQESEYRGDAEEWITALHELRDQEGFDDFIFWPRPATAEQVEHFAHEVAPALG